jgi:hypothetical protein
MIRAPAEMAGVDVDYDADTSRCRSAGRGGEEERCGQTGAVLTVVVVSQAPLPFRRPEAP